MLILSRKHDESIMINDDIEIKIISIDENKVKIGINAPKSVRIFRSEVYETIHEENINASKSNVKPDELKLYLKSLKKEE